MSIVVTCPSCTGRLRVLEQALGKRAKCPRCGDTISLAHPEAAPKAREGAAGVTDRPPASARRRPAQEAGESPPAAAPKPRRPAEAAAKEAIAPPSARRPRPAQEEEPEPLPDDADERPRKKKKKKGSKKGRQPVHDEDSPAWPWWVFGGGGVVLVMLVLLALTLFTSFGSPVKGFAVYLLVFLPLGTVIFFVAMFLSSVMLGAIEIGELHVAFFKAFFLILLVNLARLVPFGMYFTWLVWLLGLMVIFRLDLWEARVLFVINWLLNMVLNFVLIGVLLSWAAGASHHDEDWEPPGRHEPAGQIVDPDPD